MHLESYVVLHAAFVASLHKIIGIEFGTYLENGQCNTVLCEPPRIRLRDVAHARVRDLLQVKPELRAVVLHVLEHLRAADVCLAEVAQEVPQAELQRDLVRVGVAAEVLDDEGVVRVEGLLVSDAMQDDADNLALLNLGQFELGEAFAGVDVVLTNRCELGQTLKDSFAYLAAHEHDEYAPPDIGVHSLLLRQFEEHVLRRLDRLRCGSLRIGLLLTVYERISAPGRSDEPPLAFALGRVQVLKRHA